MPLHPLHPLPSGRSRIHRPNPLPKRPSLAGRQIRKRCSGRIVGAPFHSFFRVGSYLKIHSSSEFERVLQSRSLVEDEVLRSAVRIFEEISYSLKLHRNAGVVLQKSRLGISLCHHK